MSETVSFSVNEMIAMCEQMLPIWNKERYAKEADLHIIEDEFSLI